MQIREARVDDAEEACRVLRRSIAELCTTDHCGNPAILDVWLANKTPENVASWIANPSSHVFIAAEGTAIVGVAAVTTAGEVTLNYVSPDSRFRGVSKALLNALEAKASDLGIDRCTLTSTETARQFYLSGGYVEQGPPVDVFGSVKSYPMVKHLGARC
jgi:GNAT superfamily N-acetyltransferase